MPGTTTPPTVTTKLVSVSVRGSNASVNVAPTRVLIGTLTAPGELIVAMIRGAVVSGVAPVVKVQAKLTARLLSSRSVARVVIVAVKSEFGARSAVGAKVATRLAAT